MAHENQFDGFENGRMPCAVCEAMCPEAVDGTLTAAEQAAFDKHVSGCVSCAEELAEAHRGAAWMQMLKGHAPEPPARLLAMILAETSGAGVQAAPVFAPIPAFAEEIEYLPQAKPLGWWANAGSRMSAALSMQAFSMQYGTSSPRLAMTAAMAFFSIALTLNMAGVRVKDVRLTDLRPSAIRRTVADAGASSVRSFQNLRVVYEFESRVSDMRNNGDLGARYEDNRPNSGTPFAGSEKDSQQNDAQPQQAQPQQQQKQPDSPHGSSSLELPLKPANITEKGA